MPTTSTSSPSAPTGPMPSRFIPSRFTLAIALTALASGRAMTLPFIGRAGDGGAGDPPDAWLMPLLGDAVIGLSAVVLAVPLVMVRTPTVWVVAVAWNAVAVFDSLAAFVVETSAPWPEFFMLETFGRTMFFAAAGMHAVVISLLTSEQVRGRFGIRAAPEARLPVEVS